MLKLETDPGISKSFLVPVFCVQNCWYVWQSGKLCIVLHSQGRVFQNDSWGGKWRQNPPFQAAFWECSRKLKRVCSRYDTSLMVLQSNILDQSEPHMKIRKKVNRSSGCMDTKEIIVYYTSFLVLRDPVGFSTTIKITYFCKVQEFCVSYYQCIHLIHLFFDLAIFRGRWYP